MAKLPPYHLAPIDSLTPHPRNARTHSDAQIAKLAALISEYGWTNPVLVDGRRGIIAGHGRVEAARKLGMDAVPVIELAHLTPAQRRAYVIADNRSALDAGWDDELLRLELGELRDEGFDLAATGFDGDELDTLFAPEIDIRGEWEGMPEFEHGNKTAYQSILIHFADADAVIAFGKLIGQTFTNKTKSTWFPRIEQQSNVDKRYVTDPA